MEEFFRQDFGRSVFSFITIGLLVNSKVVFNGVYLDSLLVCRYVKLRENNFRIDISIAGKNSFLYSNFGLNSSFYLIYFPTCNLNWSISGNIFIFIGLTVSKNLLVLRKVASDIRFVISLFTFLQSCSILYEECKPVLCCSNFTYYSNFA